MTDLRVAKQCCIFGTPSLDHRVTLDYLRSWTETIWLMSEKGIAAGRLDRGGDCFIAKARSKMASDFLRLYPMATDLFFLDDDIGWPAKKVVEFLERPEDIVAGIYPKKQDEVNFPVEIAGNLETGELIERDGLIQATAVPTGFLRIKRHVLETLAKSAPRFKEEEADHTIQEYTGFFQSGIGPDGWWFGEDYVFCLNARAAGFDIWVDPDIDFRHRGQKQWSDNLSNHLEQFRMKAKAARDLYRKSRQEEKAA